MNSYNDDDDAYRWYKSDTVENTKYDHEGSKTRGTALEVTYSKSIYEYRTVNNTPV